MPWRRNVRTRSAGKLAARHSSTQVAKYGQDDADRKIAQPFCEVPARRGSVPLVPAYVKRAKEGEEQPGCLSGKPTRSTGHSRTAVDPGPFCSAFKTEKLKQEQPARQNALRVRPIPKGPAALQTAQTSHCKDGRQRIKKLLGNEKQQKHRSSVYQHDSDMNAGSCLAKTDMMAAYAK